MSVAASDVNFLIVKVLDVSMLYSFPGSRPSGKIVKVNSTNQEGLILASVLLSRVQKYGTATGHCNDCSSTVAVATNDFEDFQGPQGVTLAT